MFRLIVKNIWQNGGYVSVFERGLRQKRIQILKDFLLILGSWGAAVGTGGLLYFEYLKLNHHYPNGIRFWQLALGITILLLSTLLVLLLPKSRNKRK